MEQDSLALPMGSWLLFAIAVGLASGFGEVAFQEARRLFLDSWLRLGPHALWMTPLAQTTLFGLLGLLAEMAWRFRPRPTTASVMLAVLVGVALAPEVLGQPYIDRRAAGLFAVGLAVQSARLGTPRLSQLVRLARRAAPVLVGCLVLVMAGVPLGLAWQERRALAKLGGSQDHPNVLIILLDTVRAANLSVYGYERPTTPFLERFAREATRFDRAYAPSSWTLPTHASVMTGRWPHEMSADWDSRLDERFPTLPEVFRGAGYATGAFVANYHYTMSETGLNRGFIRYQVFRVTPAEILASWSIGTWLASRPWVRRALGSQDIVNRKLARHVRDEALAWIDGLRGRPFLAVLNIFDAHSPYLPPAPYDTLFGARRIGFLPRTVFEQRATLLSEVDLQTLPQDEVEGQVAAYDAAIRYIDSELEKLVEGLRQRGLLDRTVVVITSDHGEGLGEGGRFMHGNLFSNLTTHVPLLVRVPKTVPAVQVVAQEVSLRDVPATVIDLAGLPVPTGTLPGHSLVRLFDSSGEGDPVVSPAFSSFWPWRKTSVRHWAIVRGGMRYKLSDKGAEELYDVRRDPGELHELLAHANSAMRDSARVLRAVIDSIRGATKTSPRPNPWKSAR
jgi:arylsulfatase A-like enzyme